MNHPGIFAAGIFAHENGQRLLQILMSLADRGFRGLYDKCRQDVSGAYYQTGLKRVHAWSDDVIQDDIAFVRHTAPDMQDTYESCFAQYVNERFRGGRRPMVKPPSLVEFTRRFLECIGQQDGVVNGSYFSSGDTLTQRVVCMDAARQAFYTIVTTENVRVELASEVSAVAPKAYRQADEESAVAPKAYRQADEESAVAPKAYRQADEESAVAPKAYRQADEESAVAPKAYRQADEDGASQVSRASSRPIARREASCDDIGPSDSISQIMVQGEGDDPPRTGSGMLQSTHTQYAPRERQLADAPLASGRNDPVDTSRGARFVRPPQRVSSGTQGERSGGGNGNPTNGLSSMQKHESFAPPPGGRHDFDTHRSVASSRDSQVSIGVKRITSPTQR